MEQAKRLKRLYLACPYSHDDEQVREDRYDQATMKAATLMTAGYNVFSPITYSHFLTKYLPSSCNNPDFWMQQDLSYVRIWADELWVLCLDGWLESPGVQEEIINAFDVHIPVKLLRPMVLGEVKCY